MATLYRAQFDLILVAFCRWINSNKDKLHAKVSLHKQSEEPFFLDRNLKLLLGVKLSITKM